MKAKTTKNLMDQLANAKDIIDLVISMLMALI